MRPWVQEVVQVERRKFTPEFKRQVVEQANAAGHNTVVASKCDIRPNLVSKWVRQYRAGQPMRGSNAQGNATQRNARNTTRARPARSRKP
ncbi:transposase [Alicyclobacillus tolerans]|uniref:transposase n=1 Tax=Alicyclobacillus tolerans TaxID=90970 RepID=UPI003B821739